MRILQVGPIGSQVRMVLEAQSTGEVYQRYTPFEMPVSHWRPGICDVRRVVWELVTLPTPNGLSLPRVADLQFLKEYND